MTQDPNQIAGRYRVAVFASFSHDGYLPPQVLPYLEGLKPLTSAIVVVCDNDLLPGEVEKLAPYAAHVITGRHGEYDFGSYKRGFAWASGNGLLDAADDLILCNDSCYGPVGSFAPMFAEMEARGLDVWGATESHEFTYHLQSYWVVLGRAAFRSEAFSAFIMGVAREESVQKVILNYELGLTKTLLDAGFTAGALVENTLQAAHPTNPSYRNITFFPLFSLERGLPLVKVKALRKADTNADGVNRLLAWLRQNAPETYASAISDIDIRRFEDADDVAFSLIMATRNRARCISAAIASVMAQTHRNFELIIVDDGSEDDTGTVIARIFADELAAGRIRYIRLDRNVGVCRARNAGLAEARNPWIGYIDSDNRLCDYYLSVMASCIVEKRDADAFYGRILNTRKGGTIGRPFSRAALTEDNFIDLGVFIHRASLISEFGGFDPALRRLVDWDLILRFTRHREPVFVPRVFLEYDDQDDADRISTKESFPSALVAVHTKHAIKPTVSTVILSYNHQDFIVEALESALEQKGDMTHEILISDDGSTDGTDRIVAQYARKYPRRIRNISRGRNFGISENYRHCFREAAGQFVAVLEGDDYWTDPEKNVVQARFLTDHPEAAMVFSRIEVFDMARDHYRFLKRQDGLAPLLTGADFAANEHLNLIANFSSSMFRTGVMRNVPSAVYLPRINEICLSFYLDRIGKIGFVDRVMGTYRLNTASLWTGASRTAQLEQAIAIRRNAMRIARPAFRDDIRRRLDEKEKLLSTLLGQQDTRKSA